MATKNDISNSILGRFLSLEMLGVLVVIGVSWGTVSQKVNSIEDHVTVNKIEQAQLIKETKDEAKELRQEVNDINRKLDVMANTQGHFKQQIESMDDRSVRMLEILEEEKR